MMAVLLSAALLQEPAELVRRLAADDPDLRDRAERDLRRMGMKAWEALSERAEDPDPERRGRVRRILAVLELEEAARQWTGAPADAREARLRAVGREFPADPRHVEALRDVILFELDGPRRGRAVEALTAVGTPDVLPALLWALRGWGPAQERAAGWLAVHGGPELIGTLEAMGREKVMPAMVVVQAVRLRHPEVEPAEPREWKPVPRAPLLRAATHGETVSMRVRGLRAIVTGMAADSGAMAILRDALTDDDEPLRLAAAEGFTRVTSGDAVEALIGRLEDEDESVRVRLRAAVALARNGSDQAQKALERQGARDQDPDFGAALRKVLRSVYE